MLNKKYRKQMQVDATAQVTYIIQSLIDLSLSIATLAFFSDV